MIPLLISVLVASLIGSLHCVGMCGGFVAFYAGSDQGAGGRALSHVAYSGGRLLTYAALGALAGAVGASLDSAGTLLPVQRIAALLAGAAMLLWGGAQLLAAIGLRWRPNSTFGGTIARWAAGLYRALGHRPPLVRALVLGGLSTLLPCGWLWAFVIVAAGTGAAVDGLLVMTAFWLGTVPALVGLGMGTRQLARLLGRRLPALTASALIALGLLSLASHFTASHSHHHAMPHLASPAPHTRGAPSHHHHPPQHHTHER